MTKKEKKDESSSLSEAKNIEKDSEQKEKKDESSSLNEAKNIEKDSEQKEINEPNKKETPEEKLKNTQDKLLRLMAEMENQRRRSEKEKEEAFEFGGFNFARESLSLIDNLERAILSYKNDESLKSANDLDKIINGIEIIKKDLVSIFKKNGVETIDCINKKFDPNIHQAMLEIEDNLKEPGIILQEIQKGYMMKSRLLRPSLVGVSKKIQEKEEKK